MKRRFWVTAAVAALGISTAVWGATISNNSGQTCDGEGTWHFVNNQTGGAGAGLLDVCFSDSGCQTGIGPTQVNPNNQHFHVSGSGTLISASTNLPGRLVLSDFDCDVKEPPCDPKKEICPK